MNVTFDVFDANPAAMLFALVLTIRVLSICAGMKAGKKMILHL